ncbi:MAG: right-handed parallel beta-helix repeat-containing protein, partial [Pirellulaceae bacterium]
MRFAPAVTGNSTNGVGEWWTITLTSNLAALTDSGTTIDGTAFDYLDGTTIIDSNGGAVNSARTVGVDDLVFDATERPELEIFANGNSLGLVLDADDLTVRDLAIYGSIRTAGETGAQIYITNNVVTAGSATVVDSVLGARADGSDPGAARGSSAMAINGASTVTNNYMAFLDISGVRFNGLYYGNSDGSTFVNNEVHTVAGSHTAGDAITVDSQGNTVRGNYVHDVALATVVYPYNGKGIELWYDSNNNLIDNNTIVSAVTAGIGLGDNANNNTISKNVITGTTGFGGEGGAGILVTHFTGPTAPTANTFSENSIYGNFGIGIDLDNRTGASAFGDGVTANDGALTVGTPNELMDTPVIVTANLVGTTLTLGGYVGSAPNQSTFASARVEFFKSNNGQGQTYLGFLTTD